MAPYAGFAKNMVIKEMMVMMMIIIIALIIIITRPKPAYGRQGLEWDRRVRIQLRQEHFGVDTFLENIYFKKYP